MYVTLSREGGPCRILIARPAMGGAGTAALTAYLDGNGVGFQYRPDADRFHREFPSAAVEIGLIGAGGRGKWTGK